MILAFPFFESLTVISSLCALIICRTASLQSAVSSGAICWISLNSLIKARPTAHAKLTGTAFPICLYFSLMLPSNVQSSGNVCILAYSRTLRGLVSNGWQRSVCFWQGEHVSVSDGSSSDNRRAMPVFPPPRCQLPPKYSCAIFTGRLRQSPPSGTSSSTLRFFSG